MGLDMYLDRYPRYKGYTPRELAEISHWYNYYAGKESLEDFCEANHVRVPSEEDKKVLDSFLHTTYSEWDNEHKHPYKELYDNVAYWRKANAIHKWFVENVQDGEDDCDMHDEVTEQKLTELRDKCKRILDETVLVQGKVENGKTLKGNRWVSNYEDGLVVVNPEVCEKELPSTSGFFFGGTDYNQWYIEDIKHTYEVCEKLLKETDFEKQMLYYCSSW